jgi:hypothetical protein
VKKLQKLFLKWWLPRNKEKTYAILNLDTAKTKIKDKHKKEFLGKEIFHLKLLRL